MTASPRDLPPLALVGLLVLLLAALGGCGETPEAPPLAARGADERAAAPTQAPASEAPGSETPASGAAVRETSATDPASGATAEPSTDGARDGERPEGGRILGRVHADVGRVAGRRVTLDGEARTLQVVTDAEGRFRFEGLAAGTYLVVLDLARGEEPLLDRIEVIGDADVPLVLGGPPEDPIALVGTVTRGGAPVEGVLVERHVPFDLSGLPKSAHTDAQGRYRLLLAWPGEHRLRVREEPPLVLSFVEEIPDRPEVTRDLELGQGGVRGRVTLEDGTPAAGAELHVRMESDPAQPTLERVVCEWRTDADGTFVLRGLPPGHYSLLVLAAVRDGVGGPGSVERERAFVPELLVTTEPVELAVALAAPAVVEAFVRDAAGAPVEGAHLQLTPPDGGAPLAFDFAASDALGRVSARVPAGTYRVRAVEFNSGASAPRVLELAPGDRVPLQAVLRPR